MHLIVKFKKNDFDFQKLLLHNFNSPQKKLKINKKKKKLYLYQKRKNRYKNGGL